MEGLSALTTSARSGGLRVSSPARSRRAAHSKTVRRQAADLPTLSAYPGARFQPGTPLLKHGSHPFKDRPSGTGSGTGNATAEILSQLDRGGGSAQPARVGV